MMKQLKSQMDIIMNFRNKFSIIPADVQIMIDEAQKIMKVLGISGINEI